MNKPRNSIRNPIIIGLILSIISFGVHFVFFEDIVYEYRLVYAVQSEDYSNYEEGLGFYNSKYTDFKFSLSPSFQSRLDTLSSEGLKVFELRKYTTGQVPNEYIESVYFGDQYQLEIPKRINEFDFGSSKALHGSLGIGLIVLSFFLLIDRIQTIVNSRKAGNSK